MNKIILPNGCYFTGIPADLKKGAELKVFPSNWKSKKASLTKIWYIWYRFYDPLHKDKYPNGKLVCSKGMNEHRHYEARKEATEKIMKEELYNLTVRGFNPITREKKAFSDNVIIIDPYTPWLDALESARTKLTCECKKNIKYCLSVVGEAAVKLRMIDLPINNIEDQHIEKVLEYLLANRKGFNEPAFNKYRAYLSMVFTWLKKKKVVKFNPVLEVDKKIQIRQIRETLTTSQRQAVDKAVRKDYNFWRFMHIFFHSGARETELLSVKIKDIDLENQRYKVLIKKRKVPAWVYKTIKDIALPLWVEVVKDAKPDDYLFSLGLKPGPDKVTSRVIYSRWKKLVKDNTDLDITADFYSLKHTNSTEIMDILNAEEAAKLNSHESTAMVINIYDVKRETRQHDRLKRVGNSFTGE